MAEVTSLVFAEYINQHLKTKGLPPLASLHNKPGVLAELQAALTSDLFLGGVLLADMANHHYMYSTALLYALEYIEHGPGFVPILGNAFANSTSNKVLKIWCEYLLQQPDLANDDGVKKILSFSLEVASMVSVPVVKGQLKSADGLAMRRLVLNNSIKGSLTATKSRSAKSPTRVPATILSAMSDDKIDELIENATQNFKSISTRCREIWATLSDNWLSAVSVSAKKVDQKTVIYNANGQPTGSVSRIVILEPVEQQVRHASIHNCLDHCVLIHRSDDRDYDHHWTTRRRLDQEGYVSNNA